MPGPVRREPELHRLIRNIPEEMNEWSNFVDRKKPEELRGLELLNLIRWRPKEYLLNVLRTTPKITTGQKLYQHLEEMPRVFRRQTARTKLEHTEKIFATASLLARKMLQRYNIHQHGTR